MGTGYTRNDTANNIADGNIINAADLDGEFDAIESAFNSSTGHTHDGTSAEGGAILVLGPSQEFVASGTEVKPSSNAGLSLGTNLLQFNDLWLDGTAYIDGLGESILVDTNAKIQFRDTALFINSSADGQLDIEADTTIELTAPTVSLTNDLKLASDSAVLSFGADDEITVTHVHNTGLDLKAANGFTLNLQTGDTTIESGNLLGKITFNAPDEASGTDAILTAAAIEALAEATFDSATNSTALVFKTNTSAAATERMRIDSSGKVGIGSSSPTSALYVSANVTTGADFYTDANTNFYLTNSGTGNIGVFKIANETSRIVFGQNTTNDKLIFSSRHSAADNTQHVAIDNDGNLLVGKTSASFSTAGHELRAGAAAIFVRDGNDALSLNRLTSDGDIAKFSKDGTTVGSIGTVSGDAYIATGDVGLRFDDGNNILRPVNNSGSDVNGSINLGGPNQRFASAYLSGGIEIESGTGNVGVGKQALNSNTADNNTAVGYQAGYSSTTATGLALFGKGAGYSNTTGSSNTVHGLDALYYNTTGSYNTAIGRDALQSNTTASGNTAVGYQAAYANTTGTRNTALGYQTLIAAAGINSTRNTAVGYQSLFTVNGGYDNTAVGDTALAALTTGHSSTAVGQEALTRATTSVANTAVGYQSLAYTTTANNNTAVGYRAGYNNTTGGQLTAVGDSSFISNSTGDFNTGIGQQSGRQVTTGSQNTALGYYALRNATTSSYNTAVGAFSASNTTTATEGITAVGNGALYTNSTGNDNTAVGRGAVYHNTTGANNTAVGRSALENNTTASQNTAVGYQAAYANTTGAGITAVGYRALDANTTGTNNVAMGTDSLGANSTGIQNTAMGAYSGQNITTGNYNVLLGYTAGQAQTTAPDNTFVGNAAGFLTTTGGYNHAFGSVALYNNTTGQQNVAIGYATLLDNTTGGNNVGVGHQSLYNNTTASNNTAVGYQALYTNTTGPETVAVGYQAGYSYVAGYSTFVGYLAGKLQTSGDSNTYIGRGIASINTNTGNNNTGMGNYALPRNTSGIRNVALGNNTLNYTTTGSSNTAVGYQAGYAQTTGSYNTFIGGLSAYNHTTGSENLFVGYGTGYNNSTGSYNTYVGRGLNKAAGSEMTTGSKNTILGAYTGNQGGLDIRTSNNHIVLSDGDGNPRLVIDENGNVGIGDHGYTGWPDFPLHITKNADFGVRWRRDGATNNPLIQFDLVESDSSVNIQASGSTVGPMKFSRGATEVMRLDTSNNLLVGRTGTAFGSETGVQLNGDGYIQQERNFGGTGSFVVYNQRDGGGTSNILFQNGAVTRGSISWTSSSTAYNTTSDHRLKENVVDLTGATARLKQLEPKRFNFIADADTTVDGFLAHEVQSVVPEAISGTHNEVDADGNPVYQGIDQSKLVPLLVATIKELEARITALENV